MSRQYTVRAIPDAVDRALRRLARKEAKSLNAVAVEALARGLELETKGVEHTDLDALIGSWQEDPAFDRAVADFGRVDGGVEVIIALDTNAYSDFMRGDPGCVHIVRTARHLHLPLIVLGELRAGFAAGNQKSTNAANLQRFLNSPRVSVLLPDEQTTYHYAQLYWHLRRNSVAIPTNDLWIAALVVQHSLVLRTSDAHFEHLSQVPRC